MHYPWDDIDWNALVHVNESTPAAIRTALTTIYDVNTPLKQLRRALNVLLEVETPILEVRPTTLPHILDFLLTVLPGLQRESQEALLYELAGIYQHLRLRYRKSMRPSLQGMHLMIACVERLYASMNDLLVLQQNPHVTLRTAVSQLLPHLFDYLPELMPRLIDIYHNETNSLVQTMLLDALGTMTERFDSTADYYYLPDRRNEHRALLMQLQWFSAAILQIETDRRVRRNALRVALYTRNDTHLPQPVLDELQAFIVHYKVSHPRIPTMYRANLYTAAQLLQLLSHPDLSPQRINEFLQEFGVATGAIQPRGLLSTTDNTRMTHRIMSIPEHRSRLILLNVIVNCDGFWKIPTNFLSTYFDLPDNRDALRRYLIEHDREDE